MTPHIFLLVCCLSCSPCSVKGSGAFLFLINNYINKVMILWQFLLMR
ncbi:hypothetical protein VP424E501_P0299 [Vibrio phage 424E50-1]|nr:hypothetical protein VP424E501_P0299 [Vibrio phage 424E50-1]